ncbi:HAMP domain-containing protein [Sulfitobacter mediterraneus]|jgi:two-component system, OmpR family, osmolarity sensor histidine kinase EnvZ|uniref:ATP-binding protein n=1 Tax=Sulfitobacter mediterraneus TaxID=83219 RepID=UPI0019346B08|nr:ATP-binding protein [Sulfitobacter mediterraneus]MBM1632225.1 HAMP domain-containing protein [Sulfitobacter mediterraneus]MBM1640041.1 HAMP domain-containing protein [Sulfitobacter mediterraneus]MBM1644090.1 HAMP domain-containing protein [Sulfitobacter mediterraneus]MBM1648136.1 HAMP domain-containing protein [Sulfitobacter mediterraneus]MBM1652181.1 HAMP domain-containing protein [Sulfitobacter mediterraneus]
MFFVWLKRYMPRGIYGRAALILMLPVVFVQLVVTVVFAQRHFEGVTQQMTTAMMRELAMVMQVVEEAEDSSDIPSRVAAEVGLLDMNVQPVDQGAVPEQSQMVWYDYSGRVLDDKLQAELPDYLAVDLTQGNQVLLYLDSGKGPVRVGLDRRRVSASNPHQLFVYTLFFGVLMTFIASVYLRNQLRPIRRLARAAEAFGRGRHLPYTPAGAVEVRSAGAAFVDMRARIERQIEQRTLMLSGVSHDLRTPLTRMRLELSMLDEEEAAPLLQDVDDMQRMLDEFLDFAKGAGEGKPEAIEPHKMIAGLVDEARRAGRDVTLLPPEGDGTGTVMLRAVAMRRAVDNLISNAVRYGARAEVSVMLSDKTLRIRVEDDGPGIPESRRAEATRAFTRLDPARNQDKGGGVGLGLAIATDIARAHGGVLRLGESTRLGGLRADIVIAR